ncbi:MAG TPA: hypothetical protein VNV25_25450 [Gemmatimonadaceae bacterium]|nr:hypothetical protein [Gemmatimonadaceae bacterium]
MWNLTPWKRVKGTVRSRSNRMRTEERKVAIRCAWCLQLLCPKCARLHFAPIMKAQIAVDKRLAKAAALALDIMLDGHK